MQRYFSPLIDRFAPGGAALCSVPGSSACLPLRPPFCPPVLIRVDTVNPPAICHLAFLPLTSPHLIFPGHLLSLIIPRTGLCANCSVLNIPRLQLPSHSWMSLSAIKPFSAIHTPLWLFVAFACMAGVRCRTPAQPRMALELGQDRPCLYGWSEISQNLPAEINLSSSDGKIHRGQLRLNIPPAVVC